MDSAPGSRALPAPLKIAEPGPFPIGSALILAWCMTLNMYTLVNLFPYVGMMVKGLLGLTTTNEVGFYAGYVASSFTFGRFLSGYFWGSLTDRIGRKPVIIIGLLSIATFSMAFGMSGTYTMALISRFILWLTNPIMAALRTSISEICGPEHVVVGMTYLSSTKAISMVIGAGVGGLLAQPALHFPGVFSTTGPFGRYPFLLPNLVGAVMSLLALLLVIFFIPETKNYAKMTRNIRQDDNCSPKESPVHSPNNGSSSSDGSGSDIATDPTTTHVTGLSSYQQLLDGDDIYRQVGDEAVREEGAGSSRPRLQQVDSFTGAAKNTTDGSSSSAGDTSVAATDELSASEEEEEREPGLLGPDGLLAVPHVKLVIFLGCLVSALAIGFEEVYPLFALSTPDVGGLGWSTQQIGKVLVATGVLMTTCQLVLFPPIIKMVGIMSWQRLGCAVGVAAFVTVPAVKTLSWNYTSLFAVSVLVNAIVTCCFAAVLVATGALMAICQLILFPPIIKMVGIMTWQRLGCGVGVAAFVAVPAVKTLSWNYTSLFAVSVWVNAISTCGIAAVNLALAIGSTTLVSTNMRGKLGGLYNTAESLGRFLGPVSYSVTYAWSVSDSTRQAYGGWVDSRSVFYASAAVLAAVGVLAWSTLTAENLIKTDLEDDAGADITGDEGFGRSSIKDVTRTLPSVSALGHEGRERCGVDGDKDHGYLMTSVDLVV